MLRSLQGLQPDPQKTDNGQEQVGGGLQPSQHLVATWFAEELVSACDVADTLVTGGGTHLVHRTGRMEGLQAHPYLYSSDGNHNRPQNWKESQNQAHVSSLSLILVAGCIAV